MFAEAASDLLPAFQAGARLQPHRVGRLEHLGEGFSLYLPFSQAIFQLTQPALSAFQLSSQSIHQFFLFLQGGDDLAEIVQDSLLSSSRLGKSIQLLLKFFQARLANPLLTQFSDDLLQPAVQCADLTFDGLTLVGGALAVCLPHFQAKNTAQDAFTIARPLLGELVSLALQEERRVDKSFVVEAQGLLNARLGIAQGAFRQRFPRL